MCFIFFADINLASNLLRAYCHTLIRVQYGNEVLLTVNATLCITFFTSYMQCLEDSQRIISFSNHGWDAGLWASYISSSAGEEAMISAVASIDYSPV